MLYTIFKLKRNSNYILFSGGKHQTRFVVFLKKVISVIITFCSTEADLESKLLLYAQCEGWSK